MRLVMRKVGGLVLCFACSHLMNDENQHNHILVHVCWQVT